MMKRYPFAIAVAAVLVVQFVFVGQPFRSTAASAPSPVLQEAHDKSHATFMAACVKCHPAEKVTATRRSRTHWEEVINTMITTRGAQISDEDFGVVLDYLVRHHGRIEINRANAEEIVDVLEIAESMAAAIVKYRDEHGPFKDFDALVKIPGVDAKALEKKRDAIVF